MANAYIPFEQRLTEGFSVNPTSGCWEWAVTHKDGYGRIRKDGSKVLAHRASYEHYVGPVPDGLQLDHLCRNRKCVNPLHLEPVTTQENTARGEVANKTHCKAGHEFTPENTLVRGDGNRTCRECKRIRYRAWYGKSYVPKDERTTERKYK